MDARFVTARELMQMEMEDLKRGIGTEEIKALDAKPVKVVGVNVLDVKNNDGKAIGKKVVCQVKHPDKDDPVGISSVKYEKRGVSLAFSGLWLNLDSKGLIQKGSALAALLVKAKATHPLDLLDKELETVEDEHGYLAFKAY